MHSYLQTLPYGLTLRNCSPEDLLVYFEKVYVPLHSGSVTTSGHLLAAPSTISGIKSHLRQIFKQLGRGDTWDEQLRKGNPASSDRVQQWQQGQRKTSIAVDFRTTGAKEMSEAKMIKLQQHLYHGLFSAPDSSPADRALLARDGLAFSLLWETGMRGINAAAIELADFQLPGQDRGSLACTC